MTSPPRSQPDTADARFDGDADVEAMRAIWLQPWCKGCDRHGHGDGGRQWCENDVWGECEECGRKSVKYTIAEPQP